LQPLEQLARQNQLDAMVVTSSEAMRYLLDMAKAAKWLNEIKLCVNHARIAEQAKSYGISACVAETSGDQAMLDCLIKALH